MRRRKRAFDYADVQIRTASSGQRVVMMYDGILRHLRQALDVLPVESPAAIETAHDNLQVAERCILELQLALDMENGGEIAERLNELYTFWMQHLSDANCEKNPDKVEEVREMVAELRDSWAQADQELRRQAPSTS